MNAPTPPIGYWEPFVLCASAIEEGQPQPILLDSSSGTVWRVSVVLKNLACTAAAWLQQEQTPNSVGRDELTREVASLRRLARTVSFGGDLRSKLLEAAAAIEWATKFMVKVPNTF